MKELSRKYGDLLQDRRVRSEQNRYEIFSRQRNAVMTKYRRAAQAHGDLNAGLERARGFYSEMKQTVDSLSQNVESFVSNRKAEGGELLSQIEKQRQQSQGGLTAGGGADRDHEKLTELVNRMDVTGRGSSSQTQPPHRPPPLQHIPSYHQQPHPQHVYNPSTSPPVNSMVHQKPVHSPPIYPRYPQQPPQQQQQQAQPQGSQLNGSYSHFTPSTQGYNSNSYGPVSPRPGSQAPMASPGSPPQQHVPVSPPAQQQYYQGGNVPAGYKPPPPPPPGRPPQGQAGSADPWAGLSGWR